MPLRKVGVQQGLRAARLLMVLSSISPLFILWAIRGSALIPEGYFIAFCAVMVIVPNVCLRVRLRTARREMDCDEIEVGAAEDHRDHVLVYLFAMLLPFYSEDLGTLRQLASTAAALAFIVFLFWHLNLHYMNLMFAARGYRVFTVYPPNDGNVFTGKEPVVVITPRAYLRSGEKLIAYRLSNTVRLEDPP